MKIIISNSCQQPIYQQIVSQIKNAVLNGELSAADPLPSIRTLAKELQISVITTKRAYSELEREGFIVTVPGKGSYVAAENKELLQEKRLAVVEEKLADAVAAGKAVNLSLKQLTEMLTVLYEEE